MKKLLILATIIFTLGLGVGIYGQSDTFAVWDYPDSEIPNITSFQVKIDGGAYQSIGLPQPLVESDTPANHKSFRYLLPVTSAGNHTVSVRACNTTECSWDAVLVFKLIGPPTNLRIKK